MLKSISILMTGTAVAQAFTLLISPLLSRLYTPEDFGKLGTILAASSILATATHGRLTLAISKGKNHQESNEILLTATILNLGLSITAGLIIATYGALFNTPTTPLIAALIALTTTLTAQIDIFNYWQSHQKNFSLSAKNATTRSLATGLSQLITSKAAGGLITGVIIGSFLSVFISLRHMLSQRPLLTTEKCLLLKIKETLKKHKEYPIYSMPQGLLASASLNSAPLFLGYFFGGAIAGQYWLAYRILLAPIALIGGAYRQVIHPTLSSLSTPKQKKISTAKRHTFILALMFVPPSILLNAFGENLFSLVFGDSWKIAGTYSGWLALCFSMDIIKIPTTAILQNTNQHKKLLVYEAVLSALRISTLAFFCFNFPPLFAVQSFSVVSAIASIYLMTSTLISQNAKT